MYLYSISHKQQIGLCPTRFHIFAPFIWRFIDFTKKVVLMERLFHYIHTAFKSSTNTCLKITTVMYLPVYS